MNDINATLETIQQGLKVVWNHNTIANIRHMVSVILNTVVWLIGKIDAYSVLSALFVLQGTVNLYGLLLYPTRRGGLSVLASELRTQIVLAVGMILAGWLVANVRRLEILSLGSLFWIHYAIRLIHATLFLSLSIGATLSAINLLVAVVGLLSATHSKIQRAQDKAEYEKALADVRMLKMMRGGESGSRNLAYQDTG